MVILAIITEERLDVYIDASLLGDRSTMRSIPTTCEFRIKNVIQSYVACMETNVPQPLDSLQPKCFAAFLNLDAGAIAATSLDM